MCGIAVVVGLQGRSPEPQVLESMTGALVHRGPDDSGIHMEDWFGFGFRRLSILDLTQSGHQPMTTPDGQVTLVFNGEIYNYIEIRDELRAAGHRFRSTGDAEVLLHAYQEWGRECVRKLNGMWAFAIHDKERDLLFISRDRFGEKPFYMHRSPEYILMASEIKAIRRSGLYRASVNWKSASRFLVDGQLDDTTNTMFEGIEQIGAGTYLILHRDGRIRTGSYWSLQKEEGNEDGGGEEFAELFEESVRIRMRSDVPVGVFLSGGLDSTSIICSMARQTRSVEGDGVQPMLAFSYNPPRFDEGSFIGATIAQSAAQLVPLQLSSEDVWGLLREVLESQDEPVHTVTAVVGYALMRLAREHDVTVVLNGQGADETLAGYPSYFRSYWHTLMRHGRWAQMWRELTAYAGAHGKQRKELGIGLLRHAVLQQLSSFELYRRASRARRRLSLRDSVFTPELLRGIEDVEPARHKGLSAELAAAVESFPLPLYLRVEDRNSMAHSVEARLPFLDHRLVELAFSRSASEKMRGPWNKYILRTGMKGRIPELVRTRVEKFGFPTPVDEWVAGSLREEIRQVVTSREAKGRELYKSDRLAALLQKAEKGDMSTANLLVRIAQFEMWMEGLKV